MQSFFSHSRSWGGWCNIICCTNLMSKTSKYRLDIWELKRNQNATLLTILFRPFGFIAPKTWSYLAFQSFDSERTWRLFWAYLKVILSVPEGYSERTWRLFWAYLKVILSVPEGYSERTWRLFWAYLKVILSVPEGYSERTWRLFWAYLKVIPETRRAH
jgi:hypothetical protein